MMNRSTWIVLAVCLLLLVSVQQVGAGYTETFQDGTADDVTTTASLTTSGQQRYLSITIGQSFTTLSYPTDYWAFTAIAPQTGNLHSHFYESDGVSVIYSETNGLIGSITEYHRYWWERGSDLKYRAYMDGALVEGPSAEYGDIPFYFKGIQSVGGITTLIDDIVYGSDEEPCIVSTIPPTWFVAKDIFTPSFSGVYDVPEHQINGTTLVVQYANDDGSSTITIADVATGTVRNTTTKSGYAGIVLYNLTTLLFNSGAPYGQYRVYMSDISGTAEDYFWYKAIATSGTSVEWDDTNYGDGDEATITFSISISNWLPDDYTYELRLLNGTLDEKWSTSIGARPINATQELSVTTTLFPITDTYYATLYATDKSSGEEILLVFDDADVVMPGSGDVTVEGYTLYAINGTIAGGANVNVTQLGATTETISDVTDGSYKIEDLITDWSIGCNASLTGYESYGVFFTPLAGGTYNVNLTLVPTGGPQPGAWYDVTGGQMTTDSSSATATSYWNATLNGTSVGGIVYEAPYWNPASGALVNLSNSTWSDTYLVGAGGWYQFDNLTQSQYTLSISKDGFATCSGTVTPLENQFTRKDAYLEIEYILTVNVKSLMTLGFITSETCTVSLSTGQTGTTSNGTVVFSGLSYNVYDIVGSCEGYYPGYTTIVLDEDMAVDVYLTPESEDTGPASNYPPHSVRFTYVDAYGNPITGATVTANAQESTNPWTWLSSAFGFNTNLTDIQNTELEGTTGSDGTLSFLMVETVQYRVNCVKASAGINHSVDIYPKESEYFIRIGALPHVGSGYPTYSVNATTSGTNVILFGNYSDTSGQTNSVLFLVLNSSGSELYNTSMTLTGGIGSSYFTVNNTKGTQLKVGIVADHDTEGTIEKWIDVTLKGPTGRLIDFGEGWTDFMYIVMSLACIFLVAGCFGEMDVKMGAVLVPVIGGGLFLFIGWLPESYGILISVAGFMGVLYYMRSKMPELDK